MKKEVVYSLRMRKSIRDALKRAAKAENRSVASLLDTIIKEYLRKKRNIEEISDKQEHRWFNRREVYRPACVILDTEEQVQDVSVVILDISFGGVLIAYPKSEEIKWSVKDAPQFKLCFDISKEKQAMCFQCEVNRVIDSGYGVQVGAKFVYSEIDDLQKLRNYFFST